MAGKRAITVVKIIIPGLLLFFCLSAGISFAWQLPPTPLPMEALRQKLLEARGAPRDSGRWPRTITFTSHRFDYRSKSFVSRTRTLTLERRPQRIIAHAVGISEILWAICPRQNLVLFNQVAADPRFSMIAGEVEKSGRVFNSRQTELVIAARPDLVLTVTFSDASFKERLRRAGIRVVDFGAPDSLAAVLEEIAVLGRIIGEEGNAEALLTEIRQQRAKLKAAIPDTGPPPRLLFYDHGGYIPGTSSNFNSLCQLIGAVNLGAQHGIKSWRQIDNETLLKWDPEIILVTVESGLKKTLAADPLLAHARAVREKRVLEIPGVYLQANSQFILLSANLLAGIVYRGRY